MCHLKDIVHVFNPLFVKAIKFNLRDWTLYPAEIICLQKYTFYIDIISRYICIIVAAYKLSIVI